MNANDKIELLNAINQLKVGQVEQNAILERNTASLEHHIKRTDLLEKKIGNVFKFAIFSAGIVAARYSPEIFKIIGALL